MFKNLTLNEIYNKEELFDSLVPGTGMVLIGRAEAGPAMTIVKADTYNSVRDIFGMNSELTNAYVEATASGASQIYLVRVNGTHAETNIQDIMTLTSTEAVDEAGGTQYQISTNESTRYLIIRNLYTGYGATYNIAGKKISEIVSEINIDAISADGPVYATLMQDGSSTLLADELFSPAQTNGGSTEANGVVYTTKMLEVLSQLEAYPIAQIGILCDAFYIRCADGAYLYQKLAEFTSNKARACMPCIITIGADGYAIRENRAYDFANSIRSLVITECQVSEYINIVLANPVFSMFTPTYMSNGVAAYCGLIDSAHYSEGTTNMRVVGATADSIGLTSSQKAELSSYGYVVYTDVTYAGEKQLRVLKGVNLVKASTKVVDLDDPATYVRRIASPMSSVANVKLVQHILYELDKSIDTETVSDTSVIKSAIEEILKSESEYIKNFSITESEILNGFTKNYQINIEITPVGEIENISLSVQSQ